METRFIDRDINMRLIVAAAFVTTLGLTGCNSFPSFYKSVNKTEHKVESKTVTQQVQVKVQTPLQQLFSLQPELVNELNQVSIQQVFNQAESPTAAQVTVLRTGLLDDSVQAIRTVYQFKLQDTGHWQLKQVQSSYQCQRGKNSTKFQLELCS